MKKNVLVLVFAMVSAVSSAQFTIWEDKFDDGNAEGWTLLDGDANNSNWLARKNIAMTESGTVGDGNVDILGSYHINMMTGSPLAGTEENWAVSPVLDLSFYAAPISMGINAQSAIYGGDTKMFVYLSASPELDSFLASEPIEIQIDRINVEGEEFHDFTVDLSAFSGYSTVYVALVTREMGTGVEVNSVNVTATTLGLEDIKKDAFLIKQNPVQDYLEIQAADQLSADASMAIYTTNGVLVKQTAFNEEGVFVGNLSSGIYFVVVSDGQTTERLKFVKK